MARDLRASQAGFTCFMLDELEVIDMDLQCTRHSELFSPPDRIVASEAFDADQPPVGVLLSGGLDSAILVSYFLERGRRVQPFYTRCGLCWEPDEIQAAKRYCAAIANRRLQPLIVLDLPLTDVYGQHWSITGKHVPALDSPDQAVFLPGRNALLAIKAAFWCQMHRIHELALATLESNPFPDATPEFFKQFESVLRSALSIELQLLRPFGYLDKRQVMKLGNGLPLELTFSCIAPIDGRHCGRCNKCKERKDAFRLVNRQDLTPYADSASTRRTVDVS
jgi:7-cyano-7-deazaguanine synthase